MNASASSVSWIRKHLDGLDHQEPHQLTRFHGLTAVCQFHDKEFCQYAIWSILEWEILSSGFREMNSALETTTKILSLSGVWIGLFGVLARIPAVSSTFTASLTSRILTGADIQLPDMKMESGLVPSFRK
jgi:hypothetical protein